MATIFQNGDLLMTVYSAVFNLTLHVSKLCGNKQSNKVFMSIANYLSHLVYCSLILKRLACDTLIPYKKVMSKHNKGTLVTLLL